MSIIFIYSYNNIEESNTFKDDSEFINKAKLWMMEQYVVDKISSIYMKRIVIILNIFNHNTKKVSVLEDGLMVEIIREK